MTISAKPRRSPIRAAEPSIRGTMTRTSNVRETVVAAGAQPFPRDQRRPAAPRGTVASPIVTEPIVAPAASPVVSGRVAIPTRTAGPPAASAPPLERARPRGRAPGVNPAPAPVAPPVVAPPVRSSRTVPIVSSRQIQAARSEIVGPSPSKLGELRSTIARMQIRIDQLEADHAEAEFAMDRLDQIALILNAIHELLAMPDGILNRRRLEQKIIEAKKVLG